MNLLEKIEKLVDVWTAVGERQLGAARAVATWSEMSKAVAAEMPAEKPIEASSPMPELAKRGRGRPPKEKVKEPKAGVRDAVPALTEDQSKEAVKVANQDLLLRFDKKVGDVPEGYNMARKMLAEVFKVETTKSLSHEQRLQYVVEVRKLIAGAAKQTAPVVEAAGIGI